MRIMPIADRLPRAAFAGDGCGWAAGGSSKSARREEVTGNSEPLTQSFFGIGL